MEQTANICIQPPEPVRWRLRGIVVLVNQCQQGDPFEADNLFFPPIWSRHHTTVHDEGA
jgi:hypothetical protein